MAGFTMDHKIKTTSKTSAILIDMRSVEELIARKHHVGAKGERVGESEKVWASKGGSVGFKGFFLVAFKTGQCQ